MEKESFVTPTRKRRELNFRELSLGFCQAGNDSELSATRNS